MADSIVGQPYPWVQYLLGGSKEQLAVWHGQQMSGPFCDTAWRRNVFLYPTEYLTNGIGWNGVHEDLTPIITTPDGSKEYRISDHLASLRASLTPGISTKYYDYDPWGGLLSGTATRRMYNDREEDKESSLYNNGVRKLEEGLGRFTAIDPLWEKFLWQSPYVYGDNDPLRKTDPKGLQAGSIGDDIDPVDATGTPGEDGKIQVLGSAGGGDIGIGLRRLWQSIFGTESATVARAASATQTVGTKGVEGAKALLHTRQVAVSESNATTTSVYRAVSQAELSDIAQNGLRNLAGGYETTKLFAPTAKDAAGFGQLLFRADQQPFYVIEARISSSIMNGATPFRADGFSAIAIPSTQLSQIQVNVLNYTPLVRIKF
ncbi:MAG: hypothetical protein IPM61_01145 [Chlorobi bacterium]|nr:hypothetical protein [Chlorobiota bacterium]